MFSGIVEKMGIIRVHELEDKWGRLAIEAAPWPDPVQPGESIAIGGICLTVTTVDEQGWLYFDVLKETFERTTLGTYACGRRINMERSLRYGQTMGGHIVVGHVDGIGRVESVRQEGRDWAFEFSCSDEMLDGIVYKGSVGVDGVSLTIAELREKAFSVHIIPFTYENTTFCDLQPGSPVNLEIDLLGKYVRRLLERGRVLEGVTWESLRETGLIPADEQGG